MDSGLKEKNIPVVSMTYSLGDHRSKIESMKKFWTEVYMSGKLCDPQSWMCILKASPPVLSRVLSTYSKYKRDDFIFTVPPPLEYREQTMI